MTPAEMQANVDRINFLRQKVLNNEAVTDEELQEAIQLLRQHQSAKLKPTVKVDLPEDLGDLFK